jgi:hypothetical protein
VGPCHQARYRDVSAHRACFRCPRTRHNDQHVRGSSGGSPGKNRAFSRLEAATDARQVRVSVKVTKMTARARAVTRPQVAAPFSSCSSHASGIGRLGSPSLV